MSAVAALPPTGTIDVNNADVATTLTGVSAGDLVGTSLAPAGDVNGDGTADLLIAAPGTSPRGRAGAGTVHVVFGASPFTPVNLATPGARGFRIDGAAAGDSAGRAVSAAGDVNGDGRGDILVGAAGVDRSGTVLEIGAAYVVYGSQTPADVDLASLGAAGIRINGANGEDQLGGAVAAVGDVNGDGLGDLALGASGGDPQGRAEAGSVYVVFGSRTPKNVEAGALPAAEGLRIDGPAAEATAGSTVQAAGDVNGDGRPDIAIGAPFADAAADREGSGAVFVVMGRTPFTGPVDLSAASATTLRIDGAGTGAGIGTAIAAGGDLNGDGRAEILIGIPRADPGQRTDAGEVVAVRGRVPTAAANRVDLAMGDEVAWRVEGASPGDRLGAALAAPVDLTGDGRADLAVGTPGAGASAGTAYIVSNLTGSGVNVGAAGAPVATATGSLAGDELGASLAVADLNRDGIADLALGSPGADPAGRLSAGGVRVLTGPRPPAPPPATPPGTPSTSRRDPAKPDTTGVRSPFVLRSGPGVLIGSQRVSRAAIARAGCLRLRLQASAVGTASVALRQATSRKVLASKSAPFLTPGFRPICLKLPRVAALKVGAKLRVTLNVTAGTKRTSAARVLTLSK